MNMVDYVIKAQERLRAARTDNTMSEEDRYYLLVEVDEQLSKAILANEV